MKQRRYLAAKLGGLVVASSLTLLWLMERRRPLRASVESSSVHDGRNVAVAALAAAAVQLLEAPAVESIAAMVERRRWGIVPRVSGPAWVRTAASLVLLDYTLYLWHVLVHRVPLLWRFHIVHHVDRDLTATTALRFHFGELALSVPWRAMQIAAIGVSRSQLHLWQHALLVSILFHHSNLQLNPRLERMLARLVMTPRLHGIHHADVERVRNCNWSSGLTIWDWIHGTLRNDVPLEAVTIGVAPYEGRDVGLRRIIAMPFTAGPGRSS